MNILLQALDALANPGALRRTNGALHVVLAGAEYAEISARGEVYAANAFAGTAKAPVVAPPTTSPEWALWNGHPTKSMVILSASAVLISGTSGVGLALLGAVTGAEQLEATMAEYASSVVGSLSGAQNDSKARIVNNPTIVGGTPAWDTLAAKDMLAQDAVGLGLVADNLKGAFVVPPKFAFGFEVLGETGTTALYAPSFRFALVDLPRGK